MKIALCIILLALTCWSNAAENVSVVLKTTAGDITILLDANKAPVTVKNFLKYVDSGEYEGTIFHRVIAGFMIQAGGMDKNLTAKPDGKVIHNEADNGVRNLTGTIAMARTNIIDSADRQFFINVSNNASLDHTTASCTREDEQKQKDARQKGLYKPVTCKTFGYAVFGYVTAGMDVVRQIESTPTSRRGVNADVPLEPISIIKVARLHPEPPVLSEKNPSVVLKTSAGDITIILNAEKAPVSVENFLGYVDSGGYDGTIFHRVISGFMIQGGGLDKNLTAKPAGRQIHNEADNGLLNLTGTIAMARTNAIDSADRQFYINVNDNTSLDHTEASCSREDKRKQKDARQKGLASRVACKSFGYAVFGHVTAGMHYVRQIESAVTARRAGGHANVPVTPISIYSIERVQH